MTIKQISKFIKGKNTNQIVKSICGDMIGVGLYRDVYILKQNPAYVVKIERDITNGMFANVTEWRNYINNREWKWFEKWLAPCEIISATGQVLIQQKVTHGKRKDYPKYIPAIFTDLKVKNFGFIGKRFVCCDYSFLPIFTVQLGKRSMKYAKWWGSIK